MIQLSVLPMIAAPGSSPRLLFLVVERIAVIGGQVVANGIYSVAILLLSVGLSGYGRPVRWAVGLGYGVFALGMLLVLAGLVDHPGLAAASGVLTILFFCVWVVLAANFLDRVGAGP